MFRSDNISRSKMNKQAVLFGALTGLFLQISTGIVMEMLWSAAMPGVFLYR